MGKVIRNVQEEPLFTVRPRYIVDQAEKGERGTRAKFTLLSFLRTTKQQPLSAASDKIRKRLLPSSTSPYADFLITSLSYGFQEKIQLQPLFGDKTAAYAFGASPVILQIQGIITDDIDNNWFYKFMLLYRDHLRGTKLARNFELAQLATNNAIFTGIVMSLGVSQEAANDSIVAFNLQFLVRDVYYLSANQEDDDPNVVSIETQQAQHDGTYTYGEVRAKKELTVTQEISDKLTVGGQTVYITTVRDYTSDHTAILDTAQNNSITGIGDYLSGLAQTALGGKTKLTMFESFLLKKGASAPGQTVLSVLGTYGNFINTLNTNYIGGFGNFVGEIQRNVEAFNRAIGYLGVSELVDTAANVRDQINKMKNLVNTVKETYNSLKNLKNVFKDLESEFDEIEKAWGNLRGSVSNFNESTSDRLKGSMRSSSSDLPAVLGNSALGISPEAAASIMGISLSNSTNPLNSLITGAGQNTSIGDIISSIAGRINVTEKEAENLLLSTFSTEAPSKAVIPVDKPTSISSSSNTAILVF